MYFHVPINSFHVKIGQIVNSSKMHTHIQCMFLNKAHNEFTNRIVIINLCILACHIYRANAELLRRRKKVTFLYELYERLIWFRTGVNFTKRWSGFHTFTTMC